MDFAGLANLRCPNALFSWQKARICKSQRKSLFWFGSSPYVLFPQVHPFHGSLLPPQGNSDGFGLMGWSWRAYQRGSAIEMVMSRLRHKALQIEWHVHRKVRLKHTETRPNVMASNKSGWAAPFSNCKGCLLRKLSLESRVFITYRRRPIQWLRVFDPFVIQWIHPFHVYVASILRFLQGHGSCGKKTS